MNFPLPTGTVQNGSHWHRPERFPLLFAVILSLMFCACREQVSKEPPIHLNPNMDNQYYFEAQEPNPLFAFHSDGRAMRPQLPHTVAAGTHPYRQISRQDDPQGLLLRYDEDWLATDPTYYRGYQLPLAALPGDGAACSDDSTCPTSTRCVESRCQPILCSADLPCGDRTTLCTAIDPSSAVCRPKRYQATFPPALNAQLDSETALAAFLQRGQQRFNIYCAPCHGSNGGDATSDVGTGIVKLRIPSYNIPSYHTDARRGFPLGRIFETISLGFNTMPSFAAQIPVKDRWAIAAYVRVLQRSRHVPHQHIPQNIITEKGWAP